MTAPTISARELWRLSEGASGPRMIDVRTPAEYAQIHAEGAVSVPLDRLDPAEAMLGQESAPGKALYVLCKSGARAARACARFHAAGFPNVICVEGGTDAWVAAGLPVVRGAVKVISLERQVRIAAGVLVLAGVMLGWQVHPVFYGLSALIGAGLTFSGITDWCGMGLLLARMPWNSLAAAGPREAEICSR